MRHSLFRSILCTSLGIPFFKTSGLCSRSQFFPLYLVGMINRAGREVSISCMSVAPAILISISLRHYIIISFSVSCLLFLAHACLIKTPPAKFIFFFSPLTLAFFFFITLLANLLHKQIYTKFINLIWHVIIV